MSSHSTPGIPPHVNKTMPGASEALDEPPAPEHSTWFIRTARTLCLWDPLPFKEPTSLPCPVSNPDAMLRSAIGARDVDGVSRALIAGAAGMPDSIDPTQTPLFECSRSGWFAGAALLLPTSGPPACIHGLLLVAQEANSAGHKDLGRLIESRARSIQATGQNQTKQNPPC